MCITTNDFCMNCTKKLKNKEVTKVDIAVGKIIIKVSKQFKVLNSISLEKIILTNNATYLLVKEGDKKKLEEVGFSLLNELSDAVGTDIIYLEKVKNVKKFVEEVTYPTTPVKTSTVFIPPFGEKELKVEFKKADKSKIKISQGELSSLTHDLYGLDAHYAFT